MPVPVIDLFAGPGGLGEGFSRSKSAAFQVAVSIEKDGMAHETLRLRAAHRALQRSGLATPATWRLWDNILTEAPWNTAFDQLRESGHAAIRAACEQAREEAWNLELSPETRELASAGIRQRLLPYMRGTQLPGNAVLIGGPPCQAYSVVGRSRNRGKKDYKAEDDQRHFLYREYLHVISEFRPAVFVMENVKGILSSKVQERQLFEHIIADLRRPDLALGSDSKLEYRLVALGAESADLPDVDPERFLVRAEEHGVPQARHRVIICGVRRDVFERAGTIPGLQRTDAPSVRDVVADLPRVRCGLSFRGKGIDWRKAFDARLFDRAAGSLAKSGDSELLRVARRMESARTAIRRLFDPGTGDDRAPVVAGDSSVPAMFPRWYRDRTMALLANHESRSHMPSDLARYLFVAAFGEVTGRSPKLGDFPVCLLPKHKNVDPLRPHQAIFKDRFRVQLGDTYSMTVTSHISKDGHAFIHYDPTQCRSLTVREAARLQTFPDSYVFLGNRTSQYTQVGNAVPPYLARQIADIVGAVLHRAGIAETRKFTSPGQEDPSLPDRRVEFDQHSVLA
jgi:DNA (cytosine-5)-methyltransferase 1